MLRTKVLKRRKRKNIMSLKIEGLFSLILTFAFLSALPFELLATTDKTTSITLNLEEWLILEVTSNNFQAKDIGNKQAQVEALITAGHPVYVRALLAVSPGKKVTLNAVLFNLENSDSESDLKLKWLGEGDLISSGLISLNKPTTLAQWQNQGLKTGTIIFENIDESNPFPLKGIFSLISY